MDALQDLTESYNNTQHSTTYITPKETSQPKYNKYLWMVTYEYDDVIKKEPLLSTGGKLKSKMEIKRKKPQNVWQFPYRYKMGDTCRLSSYKRTFTRSFHQNWTTETFVVCARKVTAGQGMYMVKDYNNQVIDGWFKENQLQKVTQDQDTLYRIEKIVKRSKGKVLVKWEGYSDKFLTWLPEKDLVDISPGKETE